jgi:hypothetical protein
MSFVIYFAVLLVSAAAVMFGVDLVSSPLPKMPPSVQIGRAVPAQQAARGPQDEKPAVETGHADGALSPVYPARPAGGEDVRVVYPPTTGPGSDAKVARPADGLTDEAAAALASRGREPATDGAAPREQTNGLQQAPAPADKASSQPDNAQADNAQPNNAQADKAQAANNVANSCNVQVCEAAYRSFRASDCTYQPFEGSRQLCARGDGDVPEAEASQPKQQQEARTQPDEPRRKRSARQAAPSKPPVAQARKRDEELRDVIDYVRRQPLRQPQQAGGQTGGQAGDQGGDQGGRYDELREVERIVEDLPPPRSARREVRRDHELSETERIVRKMTRGRGEIAVQRADGSIVIVDTGR